LVRYPSARFAISPLIASVVFVEFTRTSKALGCILEKLGIDFLYYNGTVTTKRKDLALEEFRENPERKILVSFRPLYPTGPSMI
jgi:SNF2 family DNA or RNA helicase